MSVSRTVYIGPYLEITAPHDNFDPNVVCGVDTFCGPWQNASIHKGDILYLLPNHRNGGGIYLPSGYENFIQRLDETSGYSIDIFKNYYFDEITRLDEYCEKSFESITEFGIFQWYS